MGKDYYQILQIEREAKAEEVNRAYRRLALKYHPSLSRLSPSTSCEYFGLVCEAYEVLSDSRRRAFFDKFGEEHLKQGLFLEGQLEGGYRFKGNSLDIFERFVLENNNLADMFDKEGRQDHGSMFGHAFGNMMSPSGETLPPKQVLLFCSLDELYNGASKSVTYSRQVLNPDGKTTSQKEQEREVEIKPGFNQLSQICFPGEGNQGPGQASSDLVFCVQESGHDRFCREGHNLIYTHHTTLYQALTAQAFSLVKLDGSVRLVSPDQVISPSTTLTLEGEGMPVLGQEHCRGDLLIRFNIAFPKYIDTLSAQRLSSILQ